MELPRHFDYEALRQTPSQTRHYFMSKGSSQPLRLRLDAVVGRRPTPLPAADGVTWSGTRRGARCTSPTSTSRCGQRHHTTHDTRHFVTPVPVHANFKRQLTHTPPSMMPTGDVTLSLPRACMKANAKLSVQPGTSRCRPSCMGLMRMESCRGVFRTHPPRFAVVGQTCQGDIDRHTRMKCYKAVRKRLFP